MRPMTTMRAQPDTLLVPFAPRLGRLGCLALSVGAALGLVLTSSCSAHAAAGDAPATHRPTVSVSAVVSAGRPHGPGATTPGRATTGGEGRKVTVRLRAAVRHLAVAARTHSGSYDRDKDFGDWAEQGGGCDTRAVVLKAESTTATTQNEYCTVETGRWVSFYNAQTYTDAGDVQIDHVVPVENVWVSGGWHWTPATRTAYYNDLGDPRTLVAVDAHDNESKGDQSPDAWMPPQGHCRYIRDYIAVKVRWSLHVTGPEEAALAHYAAGCANLTLHITRANIHTT